MACCGDDDEVVEEMPVFLSRSLQDNLYVLQYSQKVRVKSSQNMQVSACHFKPRNKELKIDYSYIQHPNYFDRFKAKEVAAATKAKTPAKSDINVFKDGFMDKYSLKGTPAMKTSNTLLAGVFVDKEFHITPLTNILKLRHSFLHFEKQHTGKKREKKLQEDSDEDEEELEQVTVKFSQPSGTKKKIGPDREKYLNYIKRFEDEPWSNAFWRDSTSTAAEIERQKLYTNNQQISHQLTFPVHQFIEKLVSRQPIRPNYSKFDANDLNNLALQTLPLPEQLKSMLKSMKVLTFGSIMKHLQKYVEPNIFKDIVLRTLPQVGILVSGNWVVQSDVLYPPNEKSAWHNIPGDMLARARDYIIFKMSKTGSITRSEVFSVLKLPSEELLDIFKSIGKQNVSGKWECLLPPDEHFIRTYPDVVEKQAILWKAMEITFIELEQEKSLTPQQTSTKRVRKRSFRDSKPFPTPNPATPTVPIASISTSD